MDCLMTVNKFDLGVGTSCSAKPFWGCSLRRNKLGYVIQFDYDGEICDIESRPLFTIASVTEYNSHTLNKCLDESVRITRSLVHRKSAAENTIPINKTQADYDYVHVTIHNIFEKAKQVRTKSQEAPLVGLDVRDESIAHDHVLIVGDWKFYVQKSILSFYSTYFERMFNGNFVESHTTESTLEEIDPAEFYTLLQFLYPGTHSIAVENVALLWKLADRFAVSSVANMCEQFVCNLDVNSTDVLKLSDRIDLASQFRSTKLMKYVSEALKGMQM